MSCTYYLFRHGETDWNAEQRFQGHVDIPLNDRGRLQAQALVPLLEPLGLDGVVSSDLSRAVETGQVVATALGIPLAQDVRLREAYLGEAQGLTLPEIRERFGLELAQRWRSTRVTDADIQYPGGETGRAVMLRALAALEGHVDRQPGFKRVGVACHGGVIRRLMQAVLADGHEPLPIPNGVIYEIAYDPVSSSWAVAAEPHARWLERARDLDSRQKR